MQDIQAQIVLNPTKVGNSFFSLAQIKVRLVPSVKKYSHQIEMPNIKPGIMMQALAVQLANSTVL